MKKVKNDNSLYRKNKSSIFKYVDHIFHTSHDERNPKVLVIRIDLHYKRQSEGVLDLNIAKEDFKLFLKYIKKSFSILGYIWKLEFGYDKGFHYHVLIFLDGQKHQQDVNLSKIFGDKWLEITQKKGTYWNCNSEKDNYYKLGIGMIRKGTDEYKNLKEKVIEYFLKPDNYMKIILKSKKFGDINIRTMGKGGIPKTISKRGRKAKKS